MSDVQERRRADPRLRQLSDDVAHLHSCVESIKEELTRNTEVTAQVRDVLSTFRVLGAVAKWLTVIGAFLLGAYHGAQALFAK